jgi:type IX secretion system PorP/SprF family membrane protein
LKRKQSYKFFTIVFAFVFVSKAIEAQDLSFSQYYNNPMLINPANTGFNPDRDYRIGGNYRNQWASLSRNPFQTMSLWGDAQLFDGKFDNGWIGIGGYLMSDVAGAGTLRSTRAYLSTAYHQMLSDNILLSAGFSGGMVQKRVDFAKLTFDNQWNGSFFDITIPSGETFATNAINYYGLNMGLNLSFFLSDNLYLNGGFSLNHINRPREEFFSSSAVDTRIRSRSNYFLNASIKIDDNWIINPNAYYTKVGNTDETLIGARAFRNLSGDGMQQLILGVYYRNGDAAIPVVGFQTGDLQINFNYDATISSLNSFNQTRGAYELGIVFSGLYSRSSKALNSVKCAAPRF